MNIITADLLRDVDYYTILLRNCLEYEIDPTKLEQFQRCFRSNVNGFEHCHVHIDNCYNRFQLAPAFNYPAAALYFIETLVKNTNIHIDPPFTICYLSQGRRTLVLRPSTHVFKPSDNDIFVSIK